jgi:hypothetical protein
MNKVALLERIAAEWNGIGITYSVAHGIDGYPEQVGRDLDVLIARRDIARGMDAAQRVLEESGANVGRPPRLWGERVIALLDGPTPDMLEVHAVRAFTWNGSILADSPVPSERIGPFAIDPWVSFVKRIIMPLLAGASDRFRGAPSQLALSETEWEIAWERLPPLVGAPLATALLHAVAAGDVSAADRHAPALRRALALRGPTRHPAAALMLFARAVRRKLAQPFSPCAPVVALVAPPAVDREAIVRAIAEGDRLIFTRCVVRTWGAPSRTGALATGRPRLTRGAGTSRHWLRIASHCAHALRTTLARDRFASMRQQLVLYDGCALDLLADPARFGLTSTRGAHLCWRLLPKPDLILFVPANGTPREAAPPELLPPWESLLERERPVVRLAGGNGSVASLRCEALTHIARTFVQMHARRSPARAT